MYRANVTHIKNLEFAVKSGNTEFVIDAKGSDLTPPSALLASLGSCMGVYIRKYAQGSKLPLENFSISLEADFTKEPVFAFKTINVAIDFKGTIIDERRKQALLEFIKNCPVQNTLKANPDIKVKIL